MLNDYINNFKKGPKALGYSNSKDGDTLIKVKKTMEALEQSSGAQLRICCI